ncbi:DUF1028 domain-containing protein [Rhizobium sullae]|uniref:DUF1028 domain-containing protein n=1 Tax=Rhizobium sullae TaxID=50338 RepID=UPI00117BBA68
MEHVTKLVVYLTDVRTREAVDRAMIAAFETVAGPLGDRMIAAMTAPVRNGGEVGPIHSAGLLIMDSQSWPYP